MNKASLFPRLIEPRITEALLDTPVVLLAGPRQAGKTTLVRQIAAQQELRYLTMDDALTLLSAREDPAGMIHSLDRAVVDEIQRAPQLLLAIKKKRGRGSSPRPFSAHWIGQLDGAAHRGRLTRRLDGNPVDVAIVAKRNRIALGQLD